MDYDCNHSFSSQHFSPSLFAQTKPSTPVWDDMPMPGFGIEFEYELQRAWERHMSRQSGRLARYGRFGMTEEDAMRVTPEDTREAYRIFVQEELAEMSAPTPPPSPSPSPPSSALPTPSTFTSIAFADKQSKHWPQQPYHSQEIIYRTAINRNQPLRRQSDSTASIFTEFGFQMARTGYEVDEDGGEEAAPFGLNISIMNFCNESRRPHTRQRPVVQQSIEGSAAQWATKIRLAAQIRIKSPPAVTGSVPYLPGRNDTVATIGRRIMQPY
ncbi:hypothetical protein HYALB_00002861 [Hymenoscyphus albidus]|uniref:Uncharacterized protein n=1 Tax=Hymenoscyphus albidus TaxID=595503 RepID=A0A9N9LDV9_9HELO|nr:hypothetical protein HYALB_00002861 [Hymenoscyphus albidus]